MSWGEGVGDPMNRPMHEVIQLDVGRLNCRSLRDYLGAMKVAGHDVNWHEGSGWVERRFTINVDRKAAEVVRHWVKAAMED